MRKINKKYKSLSLKRRVRRKLSARKKISGSSDVPRLCVVKSNKHILFQAIDDATGRTIFTLSTFNKINNQEIKKNINGGKLIGSFVAEELKKIGVKRVVFDRNGRAFKGILSAVTEGIRSSGILV